MNKPSKKIIALMIVAIASIASVLIGKYYVPKEKPLAEEVSANNTLSYGVTGLPALNNYEDSDNDGLKDWEELLWGTDKNNPDSDNDDTKDGEEVKLGRNPLIKGPNDKLESVLVASSTENITKGDEISRELFSKYISLSQEGTTLSTDQKEKLVAEIVEKSRDGFSFKTYLLKDIKTIGAPSKEDTKFYASIVASIQANLYIELSKEAQKTNPDVEKLSSIYQKAITDLLAVPAPSVIQDAHLGILNNYSIVSAMYKTISKFKEDPITATVALSYYKQASETQQYYMSMIADFIRYNDIIFPDGDVGNYWTHF